MMTKQEDMQQNQIEELPAPRNEADGVNDGPIDVRERHIKIPVDTSRS